MSRYSQFRQQRQSTFATQRDTPVTIEYRESAEAVDGSGFPNEASQDWDTLDTEWMHRHTLGGQERFSGQQQSAPIDTVWTMGYRSDMDPDLVDVAKLRRLRYESRYFDIVTASVVGRKEGIELVTLSRIG